MYPNIYVYLRLERIPTIIFYIDVTVFLGLIDVMWAL